MSKQILKFIPKSNKWFKSIKTYSFKTLGNFVFVDKDIYTIIFNSFAKSIQILFFKSQNKLKVYSSKIKSNFLVSLKNIGKSKIRFSGKVKSFLKLDLNSINKINGSCKTASIIKIPTKFKKLNTIVKVSPKNLLKIIFRANKNTVKLKSSALCNIDFAFETKNNKLKLNSRTILQANYKSYANCKFKIKNFSKIILHVKYNPIELKNSFKIKASPYVYRPIKLSDLYPDKIEDWYDSTLEEVFYGQEVL